MTVEARHQRNLWHYYQNQDQQSFAGASARLDHLLRRANRLKMISRPRVLNIGAGNGYLERKASAWRWMMFSLDPDAQTMHALSADGIHTVSGRIETMPFGNGQFDFVIASEIFEHLSAEGLLHGIEQIERVLAHGGWLLGTVPYRENLRLNRVICPCCGMVFHRWGHQLCFSRRDVRKLLESRFDRCRVEVRAFADLPATQPGVWIKRLVRRGLGRLGAAIASPSIYFTARRK